MRTRQLLGALALVLTGALALGGCGEDNSVGTAPSGGGDPTSRAQQVADAWRGSDAARQWHEGFFPLEELAWLPQDAWHSGEDKMAYEEGRFTLQSELPDETSSGQISWESGDGKPLEVEVQSAQAVFERFGHTEQSGKEPRLTITGAKLDQQQVRTSRGPAYIPVWYFTIKGYDQPLIRAAVAPDVIAKAPIAPAPHQSDDLMPLQGLASMARDGRSLTVVAGHGACDDGPAVRALETGDNVVLTASVRGRDDGPCTSQLLTTEVTVKLKQPLGERVLLDALSGAPINLKTHRSAQ
ncbi:hypothetical protein G6045_07530 [Streptomyces sp. YC504]|uniref:Lipoprotein n=1 Tax=Streptomyces mesophilus TaxID=1775132 RepID=A0A6G4XDA5_9ACTN|nr:hypothetical protein [Streptomyces mesophilus]NGO75529.1 hypothetical protein [Streptomyces mesophilus]